MGVEFADLGGSAARQGEVSSARIDRTSTDAETRRAPRAPTP
jgi:hypothetical protein